MYLGSSLVAFDTLQSASDEKNCSAGASADTYMSGSQVCSRTKQAPLRLCLSASLTDTLQIPSGLSDSAAWALFRLGSTPPQPPSIGFTFQRFPYSAKADAATKKRCCVLAATVTWNLKSALMQPQPAAYNALQKNIIHQFSHCELLPSEKWTEITQLEVVISPLRLQYIALLLHQEKKRLAVQTSRPCLIYHQCLQSAQTHNVGNYPNMWFMRNP